MKKIYLVIWAIFIAVFSFGQTTQDTAHFENFDGCSLPEGWTLEAEMPAYAHEGVCDGQDVDGLFSFSCSDGNYIGFPAGNSGENTNIQGCKAVINDDNASSSFKGYARIISPIIDLSYGGISLSFDYMFNGLGNAIFFVEVWDGTEWVEVLNTGMVDKTDSPVIDISAFNNPDFQIRFTHSDNNKGTTTSSWAWGVEFDNVLVTTNISPCIDDIIADNDPGECGAVIEYDHPDVWAAATVTQIDNSGLTSGDTFPVGVTTQSYQLVWDGGSGPAVMGEKSATTVGPPPPTDTCTFTVTVIDTESPVVVEGCPDTTLYASDQCGAVLNFNMPLTITFSEFFTQGTPSPHAAAWTTFRSELLSTYNYNKLTIRGTFDPVGYSLTDPTLILQIANALRTGDILSVFDGTRYWNVGNCGHGPELNAGPSNRKCSCNNNYTVRPAIGNRNWGGAGTATCSAPSQTLTVEFNIGGNSELEIADCDPSPIIQQTAGLSDGSVFPLGTTTNEFLITDAAGNSTTYSFDVTVVDTTPPTISIPSEIRISLDALGNAKQIALSFIQALDSLFIRDNCGTAQVTRLSGPASERSFTRSDVNKLFDLAVEATDEYGNKRTVSTSIRIIDDIAPVVSCHSIDIMLREDGRYALKEEDIAALTSGASDNVDAYEDLTIEAWPKAFGCEDVSDQFQIDVIVTDKSGNTSKCWVYCTVTDPNVLDINPVDDVELEVAPGVCETKITYPDITSNSPCATIEQVSGLGPDGMFPLGTTVETWKAYNTSGDTIEVSFNVTITTTNGLPTFDALADVTVDEDSPAVNIPLAGISYGIDCRPQAISVTATNSNTSLVTDIVVNYNSPDATGSLDLTLAPDMSGTDTIEVVVADDAGGSVSETFILTVNEVNDPPTIDQIENVTVDEDAPVINVPLTGISGGPASEPQDVTITTTSSNATLLSGVVVNYNSPDATGSLDLTLAPDMFGVDSIRVSVVDSEGLSHSRTFVLTVNPVNDAPFVVDEITIDIVNASHEITVTISSILGELFDDIDDDALTITTTLEGGDPLPAWITLAGDNLTAAPMIADTGSYTIEVTATDAAGATATHTFVLIVEGYPTGIGDLDNEEMNLKMYPNPTKGLVTIEFNSTNIYDVDLSVLDITGKLILQKQYSAAERISFDMSNQVSGMYFVKLGIDDKQIVKKLILDRK